MSDKTLEELEEKLYRDSKTWTEFQSSKGFKSSNPKDLLGVKKVPQSVVPRTVLAEVALGMLEGARKYGRHNYRVIGVAASTYFDATQRHLDDWWEGVDIDPESGLSHITKAITSLVVLRDAMIQGGTCFVDDRPPKSPEGWNEDLNAAVVKLLEKYPECAKVYTEKDKGT